jgi:hypothetical protein
MAEFEGVGLIRRCAKGDTIVWMNEEEKKEVLNFLDDKGLLRLWPL